MSRIRTEPLPAWKVDLHERMAESLRPDSPVLAEAVEELVAEVRRLQAEAPE